MMFPNRILYALGFASLCFRCLALATHIPKAAFAFRANAGRLRRARKPLVSTQFTFFFGDDFIAHGVYPKVNYIAFKGLCYCLRLGKLKPIMANPKFTNETRAAMVEDARNGIMRKDISLKYGCSLSVCTDIFKASGFTLSERPSPDMKDKAIALYLGGQSVEAAASHVGTTSGTLKRELRRRGIKPRPPIYPPREVDENGMLLCWGCRDKKPSTAFYLRRSGTRPEPYCKECFRKRQASYREKPVAFAKAKARYYLTNYGITAQEYDQMHSNQQGLCAICKKPETGLHQSAKPKALSVDHNHQTGRVRGLLCVKCNQGIGLLQDDASVIASALDYLQHHGDNS